MTKAIDFARPIAAALGEGWTVTNGHWDSGDDAFLQGPAGERIHVIYGSGMTNHVAKDRAKFSGSLPDDVYQARYGNLPSITTTLSKTPAQLAQEIERRLLSAYRPLLAEAQENRRDEDRRERVRDELAETLARTLGKYGTRSRHNDSSTTSIHLGSSGVISGDLEVSKYSERVKLDLRASGPAAIELAHAIVRLLDKPS